MQYYKLHNFEDTKSIKSVSSSYSGYKKQQQTPKAQNPPVPQLNSIKSESDLFSQTSQKRPCSQFTTTYQKTFCQTSRSDFPSRPLTSQPSQELDDLKIKIEERLKLILENNREQGLRNVLKMVGENEQYFEHVMEVCVCFRCKCGLCKCYFSQECNILLWQSNRKGILKARFRPRILRISSKMDRKINRQKCRKWEKQTTLIIIQGM